jgi:hypothetical protein
VRFRFRQLAVLRFRARVGADADQRMLQRRPSSSSFMIAVITVLSPRSAMTRSITASPGPSHRLADLRERHPLVLTSRRSAPMSITPSPFEPYHWFSHRRGRIVHVFLDALRSAGSFKRASVF